MPLLGESCDHPWIFRWIYKEEVHILITSMNDRRREKRKKKE